MRGLVVLLCVAQVCLCLGADVVDVGPSKSVAPPHTKLHLEVKQKRAAHDKQQAELKKAETSAERALENAYANDDREAVAAAKKRLTAAQNSPLMLRNLLKDMAEADSGRLPIAAMKALVARARRLAEKYRFSLQLEDTAEAIESSIASIMPRIRAQSITDNRPTKATLKKQLQSLRGQNLELRRLNLQLNGEIRMHGENKGKKQMLEGRLVRLRQMNKQMFARNKKEFKQLKEVYAKAPAIENGLLSRLNTLRMHLDATQAAQDQQEALLGEQNTATAVFLKKKKKATVLAKEEKGVKKQKKAKAAAAKRKAQKAKEIKGKYAGLSKTVATAESAHHTLLSQNKSLLATLRALQGQGSVDDVVFKTAQMNIIQKRLQKEHRMLVAEIKDAKASNIKDSKEKASGKLSGGSLDGILDGFKEVKLASNPTH